MMTLEKLYKEAVARATPWAARWEQCRRYAMPATDADAAMLFDSTAGDAAENLAANMFSLLTPPESAWLSLSRESELSPDPAGPQAALRMHLNDSNFYTTAHQCYLDLAVLGTACLYMAEAPIGAGSAFAFAAIPMSDVAVLRDSFDEITAVFHTAELRRAEITERYPDWVPPRGASTDPDAKMKLIQSVVRAADGFRFVAWLDAGGDFDNNVVATGTFATNPYIIFRWSAAAGEIYGRSPVMRALPDIKTANKVVELVLKNATIAVSGIWQADDDGIINLANISMTPGAIIPKAVGSSGLTPLKSGADFDVSQLVLDDLRSRIRRAMLADKMSAATDDKVMTATEVIARNTEMMRVLGATYGRILNEMIKPIVARGLSILGRRGAIEEIRLHSDAELKYDAPISQLAADEKLSGVLSYLTAANAGGFSDCINKAALAVHLAKAMHVPLELLGE
ncbi:MAG: head-tail connector protein [Rickettsiales bacterium]|jgi:hypothetical protein|nr:head-tail connector protein [Rickettsiales bacterium]